MLTGERSNGLKALIGFIIFISIIDYVKFRNKILILLSIFIIFLFTITFSDYVKYRYYNQFINQIKTKDERDKFLEHSLYIKLINLVFTYLKTTLGLVLEIKIMGWKRVTQKKIYH